MTRITTRDGTALHVKTHGPVDGAPIVMASTIGATREVWDKVIPLLPEGLHVISYDLRGHGLSDAPKPPYTMGQLISDAEDLCDALDVKDAMFVGLSIGGMIAQGLAVKRPDLIRALVLSNTGAKILTPQFWKMRMTEVAEHGFANIADNIMQRCFGKDFYGSAAMALWLQMLMNTPRDGYVGVAAAVSGTDLMTPTSGLRIPTLGIAGSQDGATPPDLVRETVDLIPGSQFALIWGVGQLACVEAPEKYAEHLTSFMRDTGHI